MNIYESSIEIHKNKRNFFKMKNLLKCKIVFKFIEIFK